MINSGNIQVIIDNGTLNIVFPWKFRFAFGAKTSENNKAIAVNNSSPYGLSRILSMAPVHFADYSVN